VNLTTLSIGGIDLMTSPYSVKSYDFPESRLTAHGASQQLAGVLPLEEHYGDAPWEVVLIVDGIDTDDVDSLFDDIYPGVDIIISEGDGQSSSTVRSVQLAGREVFREDFQLVTLSGSRAPAWRGADTVFSVTIAGGWGTAELPEVDGSLGAPISLTAITDEPDTLLALGVCPKGTADQDLYEAAGSAVTLSGTSADLKAAFDDLDVEENRGSYYIVAQLANTATAANKIAYTARSTITSQSVYEPPVANVAFGATETLNLGRVSIPSYHLPMEVQDGFTLGAATYVNTYTGGTATSLNTDTAVWQSFTLAARSYVSAVHFAYTSSGLLTAESLYAGIYATSGGKPSGTALIISSSLVNGRPSGATSAAFSFGIDLAAGTYAFKTFTVGVKVVPEVDYIFVTGSSYSGGQFGVGSQTYDEYHGGTNTADLSAQVYYSPIISFDAQTPVAATCSESSKTATLANMCRLPADYGAVIASGTFADNTGFALRPEGVFPATADGTSGTALNPIRSGPFVAKPNTVNLLVGANNALGDWTITGTITPQSITRG
jgi:hypothetical protein